MRTTAAVRLRTTLPSGDTSPPHSTPATEHEADRYGLRMSKEGYGEYLDRAIKRAGFDKPAHFGRKAGVDPSVVGRWIREEQRPSVKLLERVAPILNIPIPDLIAVVYPATTAATEPPPPEWYTDPATGEEYVEQWERSIWDLSDLDPEERRKLIYFARSERARTEAERRRAAG